MTVSNGVAHPAQSEARFRHSPAGAILRAENLEPWREGDSYRAEAARLLEEAKQEVASLQEEARLKGYSEGWDAGSKDLFDYIAKTKRAVDEYYQHLERTLTEIAIRLMKEILDDLDAGEVVAAAVRRALRTPNLGAEIVLNVAPEVLDDVRSRLEGRLLHSTSSVVNLREDPQLSPTGCKLVSDFCTIDISIDRQLAILAESLRASNIGIRV